MSNREIEWVYRCMVYYQPPLSMLNLTTGDEATSVVSQAYGQRPERKHLINAINDMIVIKATSMRSNTHRSPFVATVVAYPKGGEIPMRITRQMYWSCDGE